MVDTEKFNIETIDFTGSTNSDLIKRADAGAPDGLWLRAKAQSSGRGRSARQWVSPIGNIYASTIIRLKYDDPSATHLAFVAANAIYDSIKKYIPNDDVMIKWPNDILVNGAKICGILLERSHDAVILGVGVNLVHSPQNIDRAAISMAELGVEPPNPDRFMHILAANINRWIKIWRKEGFADICEYWLGHAHPLGQKISYGDYNGVFAGLNSDGACLLRWDGGDIITINAGDIFLIE